MQYRLLQLYLAVVVPLSSLIIFPIIVIIWCATVLFDPKLQLLHKACCLWTSTYLRLVPNLRISKHGLQHADPNHHYIIVSNHQSFLDILMGNYLMLPFKWVSKAEVFKVPFFGWAMSLNRYVSLKRGDKAGIKKMMQDSEKLVKKGCSLFIFPEGTRSKSATTQAFKPGAFILAKKLKLPILPVAIKGTTTALTKEQYRFNKAIAMSVTVLPAIPYEVYESMSLKELSQYTQTVIDSELTR